jgi:hypothetical protein
MEQRMKAQRLLAMPGIALPHEAEEDGPSGANSGVGSGTKSSATRVRDDRADATRRVVCKSLPELLSRRERPA